MFALFTVCSHYMLRDHVMTSVICNDRKFSDLTVPVYNMGDKNSFLSVCWLMRCWAVGELRLYSVYVCGVFKEYHHWT